jgi:phosphoglycolate phosphatase-like HAD superfamily hydrolase
MVGDTLAAVEAAEAAGFGLVIGIAHGSPATKTLLGRMAHLVIDDLRELSIKARND